MSIFVVPSTGDVEIIFGDSISSEINEKMYVDSNQLPSQSFAFVLTVTV